MPPQRPTLNHYPPQCVNPNLENLFENLFTS